MPTRDIQGDWSARGLPANYAPVDGGLTAADWNIHDSLPHVSLRIKADGTTVYNALQARDSLTWVNARGAFAIDGGHLVATAFTGTQQKLSALDGGSWLLEESPFPLRVEGSASGSSVRREDSC